MSKMSELSQALDELIACGKGLIKAATAIRDAFSNEADTCEPEQIVIAAPAYTFTDVRKAFSAKSQAGYTQQVKTLINSYGANKLSDVKEEDYPRLMADLEAIS